MNYVLKFFRISLAVRILCSIHFIGFGNCAEKYSAQENATLAEFRPLVHQILYRDYMNEDKFLIKWLRARNLNVMQARSMLGKAIRWRKKNKIDTILNETILNLPAIPYYNDGVSYSGNPISTFNIRAFEMRKWILAGKRDELVRIMDQAMEIGECGLRYLSERLPPIQQINIVFDYNGYNQREHGCLSCLIVFQEWLRHYESYYPFLVENALIVNAPRVITPLLNLLKPVLSPASQKSLKIFGQNKKEWSAELFKIAPRNQLRKGLGGTKPDHVPCANYDFVCMCKNFFKSDGPAVNTTVSLAGELQRFGPDIC